MVLTLYLYEYGRVGESIVHCQQEVGDKHAGGVMTPGGHQDTSVLLQEKT